MKRVLVTGSTGFIGSALTKRLKEEGYWVRGVDIQPPREWDTNVAHQFFQFDLRNFALAKGATRDVAWVFHLAANMGGMRHIATAHAPIIRDNTMINVNVVEASREKGVKKLLFSSSACVYPRILQGDDCSVPLKEEDAYPADCGTAYGWEKLHSEHLAHYYRTANWLDTKIVRFHNCYDKETEVLTRGGFKFFCDVNFSDEIATLNPETKEVEYHKPIAIQTYDYSGPMHKIKTRQIDLLVTPDHSMYYATKGWKSHTPWRLGKMSEIDSYSILYMNRGANWVGESVENVVLEKVASGGGTAQQNGQRKEISIDLWLAFLGWFLSEGSAFQTKANRVVAISQYDDAARKEIAQIFLGMGFAPYMGTAREVRVFSKQLYMAVSHFGHAHQKYIPRWCLFLPPEKLTILFNALVRGDGDKDRNRYSTVSKQLADDVAELAFKLGYGVKVSKSNAPAKRSIYRVYYSERTCHQIKRKRRAIVQYSGKIYDVTVPKHHIIMVRRNGCMVWSGNCYGPMGTWRGGREKAPAALCRKVAIAKLTGNPVVEIWGDGQQKRSFMYIDDCVEGMLRLMESDFPGPLNLGRDRVVTINELVDVIADIAGIKIVKKHIKGYEGVRSRNSDNSLCDKVLGWTPSIPLEEGLVPTYQWIEEQVRIAFS